MCAIKQLWISCLTTNLVLLVMAVTMTSASPVADSILPSNDDLLLADDSKSLYDDLPRPVADSQSPYEEPTSASESQPLYDELLPAANSQSLYDELPSVNSQSLYSYDELPSAANSQSLYDYVPSAANSQSLYDEVPSAANSQSLYDEAPSSANSQSLYDELPSVADSQAKFDDLPPVYYPQTENHVTDYPSGYSSSTDGLDDTGCPPSFDDLDGDCIIGTANVDYPIYATPPETSFTCQDFPFNGYFADTETQCQVFHICQDDGRQHNMLCPNGTVFSQEILTCDHWYNVDCSSTSLFYGVNDLVYGFKSQEIGSQDQGNQYGARYKRNDEVDKTESDELSELETEDLDDEVAEVTE